MQLFSVLHMGNWWPWNTSSSLPLVVKPLHSLYRNSSKPFIWVVRPRREKESWSPFPRDIKSAIIQIMDQKVMKYTLCNLTPTQTCFLVVVIFWGTWKARHFSIWKCLASLYRSILDKKNLLEYIFLTLYCDVMFVSSLQLYTIYLK